MSSSTGHLPTVSAARAALTGIALTISACALFALLDSGTKFAGHTLCGFALPLQPNWLHHADGLAVFWPSSRPHVPHGHGHHHGLWSGQYLDERAQVPLEAGQSC